MTDVRVLGAAEDLGRMLRADLATATRASVAVAFAKPSALQAVDLRSWCRANTTRSLRLVAGTDFTLTDLDVLEDLGAAPNAACKVMHTSPSTVFHPKLYIVERGDSAVVFVGSSNFTSGGLRSNIEANTRIQGLLTSDAIVEARRAFDTYYDHELATELSPEFVARYGELRRLRTRAARSAVEIESPIHTQVQTAAHLLIAAQRAKSAKQRWLLVTTPANYADCMRTATWGRQHEREVRMYAPGDIFFMHMTQRSEIAAMGMFTGEPYYDDRPLWHDMDGRGNFPWRIRFVTLGELRVGISTKAALAPLRPGAPKNWFHGFIQQSHTLAKEDFEALRSAFEAAVRADMEPLA